jgi:hypothetical protein
MSGVHVYMRYTLYPAINMEERTTHMHLVTRASHMDWAHTCTVITVFQFYLI